MKTFDPLTIDHPLVQEGRRCPECNLPFAAGDIVTLAPVYAASDGDAEKIAHEGYGTAVAEVCHYDCCVKLERRDGRPNPIDPGHLTKPR